MPDSQLTDAQEVERLRSLLGFVYHRSRFGLFSFRRSTRDAALADVNFWTGPYSTFWTSTRNPQASGRLWFGERP